jgi:hypothetical protein
VASSFTRYTAALFAKRKGFRYLLTLPVGRTIERLDRAGRIEVQHSTELIWQLRMKRVADTRGLRTVDHANCPLQPGLAQPFRHITASTYGQDDRDGLQQMHNHAGGDRLAVAGALVGPRRAKGARNGRDALRGGAAADVGAGQQRDLCVPIDHGRPAKTRGIERVPARVRTPAQAGGLGMV